MNPLATSAPETITCSHCGARLLLPPGLKETTFTCPRCLNVVQVASPSEKAPAALAPPEASVTPTGVAEGPPSATPLPRCSGCGSEVRSEWRFCPMCNTPLEPTITPTNIVALEKEVRRDTKSTLTVVVPLVLLLVFGIFSLAFPPLLIVGLVVLVVFFIVNYAPRGSRGALLVGGTFSCLNVILILILFSVLSTLAPFIFLAVVCSQLAKR